MKRNNHLSPNLSYSPKHCWVGDTKKICYNTREEAEVAAKIAEHDYGIRLTIYKCEYGDHWHLASYQ